MDKLTYYRQHIKDFLNEQAQGKVVGGEIETEVVFDEERERFLLIDLGWNQYQRIYNCVIHLEIRDEKIWIQRNQTDRPIADVLISMGVASEDIILGLQPPLIRECTGFGLA